MGSVKLNIPTVSELKDFDICPELGFVASDGVLSPTIGGQYQPWDDLLSQLPVLLATRRLRQAVRSLPVLNIDQLTSEYQHRRTYVTLALLTQAYVYEDPSHPLASIPPSISEPFLAICNYWGIKPILTHIGYDNWNWCLKAHLRSQTTISASEAKALLLQSLDNVERCGSFTATQDEKVFSMVPLLVEADGGSLIGVLLDALRAADTGDVDTLISALRFCTTKLSQLPGHLRVLHEQCDPLFFYNDLRPFIAGSQGMESKGLPDGFVFELSDGTKVPSKCIGATAAQSSLFQFLDLVFGVQHRDGFLREMRAYMPRKHRQFLELVEQLPGLRGFVTACAEQGVEGEVLGRLFEECVGLLKEWRNRHIALVTRYIMMPARKQVGGEGVDLKGTGGSLPLPFLKETRDETV